MYPKQYWKRYDFSYSSSVVTTTATLFTTNTQFLVDMSSKYHPEAYSLLNNNCNSFSNDLSQLLTGNCIPEYITNLPNVVRSSPLGPMIVPFLDSMEQRMKAFAQQGHTFRPDVQHLEQYQTPNSYAGALEHGGGAQQIAQGAAQGADTHSKPTGDMTTGDTPANDATANDATANGNCSETKNKAATKQAFEQQLRAEFDRLMAGGGLTPNEAAAQALRNIKKTHS